MLFLIDAINSQHCVQHILRLEQQFFCSVMCLQHKADVQRLKQENGELVRMAEELMCSLEKERQKNRALGH